MIHKTALSFWECYEKLPIEIRNLADKNFQLLRDNPDHPSLQFKKVGKVWSARVGAHYRAVATPIEGAFLWVSSGVIRTSRITMEMHTNFVTLRG